LGFNGAFQAAQSKLLIIESAGPSVGWLLSVWLFFHHYGAGNFVVPTLFTSIKAHPNNAEQ